MHKSIEGLFNIWIDDSVVLELFMYCLTDFLLGLPLHVRFSFTVQHFIYAFGSYFLDHFQSVLLLQILSFNHPPISFPHADQLVSYKHHYHHL